MNRTWVKYAVFAAALLGVAVVASAQAQEAAPGLCGDGAVTFNRFEQNLRRNFWQDTDNPAGIRQDTDVAKISFAEVYGAMSVGGFHQSYEAALPWGVGAQARTLVHLNKFSMQGSFGFNQSQGSDMCGSIFAQPGRYPVDALEFTPGRKVRQTYSFDGSISVDIAKEWRLGAGLDFKAVNLAKRKDLRHSNYVLDMTLRPGFLWHRGGTSAGFNAVLSKSSDCPKAEQVGSKETYDAFLNKGLWYGKFEGWEGSGLHLDEAGVSGLPVKEISIGAGAHVAVDNPMLGMILGVDYRYGRGTIGEKQYIWYRFPSHRLSAMLGYRWKGGDFQHVLKCRAELSALVNNESVIEKVSEGGVTTTVTHGANAILWRNTTSAMLEYSFVRDCDEFVAVLSVQDEVSTAAQMYPFVSCEKLGVLSLEAGYQRRIGPVDLAVRAGVRGGSLDENEYLAEEDSGVQTEPFRLNEYYLWDKEYRVATRLCVGVGVTYDFWKGIYVRADVDYMRAFRVSCLPGADRASVLVGLGYRF